MQLYPNHSIDSPRPLAVSFETSCLASHSHRCFLPLRLPLPPPPPQEPQQEQHQGWRWWEVRDDENNEEEEGEVKDNTEDTGG